MKVRKLTVREKAYRIAAHAAMTKSDALREQNAVLCEALDLTVTLLTEIAAMLAKVRNALGVEGAR